MKKGCDAITEILTCLYFILVFIVPPAAIALLITKTTNPAPVTPTYHH